MELEDAERVVARLRQRRLFAHLARSGVNSSGIRIVLPDGREVVWDADRAAGLEAQILLDGVLVGFIPLVPGSADFDWEQAAEVIAATDYGAL